MESKINVTEYPGDDSPSLSEYRIAVMQAALNKWPIQAKANWATVWSSVDGPHWAWSLTAYRVAPITVRGAIFKLLPKEYADRVLENIKPAFAIQLDKPLAYNPLSPAVQAFGYVLAFRLAGIMPVPRNSAEGESFWHSVLDHLRDKVALPALPEKVVPTKTIEEWLKEMPSPYRELALSNRQAHTIRYPGAYGPRVVSLPAALFQAFSFSESPEGLDFWDALHAHLKDPSNQLPEIEGAVRRRVYELFYDQLPAEYAKLAKERLDPGAKLYFTPKSLGHAIEDGFVWGATPEGREFWDHVHDYCIKSRADLPKIPDAIAEGHNPDRLTNLQVGVQKGWRLLTAAEVGEDRRLSASCFGHDDYEDLSVWLRDGKTWYRGCWSDSMSLTYRTKKPAGYFLPADKPAPERPKVKTLRPWAGAHEVPMPCAFRAKCPSGKGYVYAALTADRDGVCMGVKVDNGKPHHKHSYPHLLGEFEVTTDGGRTWAPCGVEE